MIQLEGRLVAVPPFDFRHSLEFLGHFRPAMGQQSTGGDRLIKAVQIQGQVILYQAWAAGTPDAPELAYSLHSESPIRADAQDAVRDHLTRFLSLRDDLRPFYALAEDDPAFWPLARQLYGYHQVRFPTPFENACWAVLSQRNPMSVSGAMKERMMAQFGGALTLDGVRYPAFPEPEQIALLDADELNAVIGNRWKTDGLLAAARAFASMDEHWLHEAPYEQVEKWLLSIRGIGPWSASFILLRGLGRMERLPVGEKWLLAAARRVYGQDGLTMEQVPALARPYGDYQGYWAHYLRAAG